MKSKTAFLLLVCAAMTARAEVTIRSEQLNPADPLWAFATVPRPSKSDLAQGARVTLEGNQWHPESGQGSVLVNGRLPADPVELSEEGFLANNNASNGSIVVDLGAAQDIAAINTYSWHEYAADQGARGPQVYTLSGSADGAMWTKLAEVDTRPNTTGAKWNGQHGVSISGGLGRLRYLRFDQQRTRSPLQRDVGCTGTLFAEIDVHSAATLAKAGDATAGPDYSHVQEVIVICKTHFDIGYTHRVKDLMPYYRTTMIDRAMGVMDASRDLPPEQQFVWTSPGWVMAKVLEDWPGQTPERRARIEQAFRSGKFVTHALPFSIEAELLEPEEFARGYMFADAVSKQYGLPLARGAKTTDVPSQSPSLATGLAHGGVKFMHVGCNWPSGYVQGMPPIFWWEGPDGSRVLTIYSPCYGTSTAFNPWGSPKEPGMGRNLIPPADWPYRTWAAIIVTGDNSGPPNADGVRRIFAEGQRHLPGTRFRMGTMEDFASAILAETTNLPVVKGETPDTWIHGCMSDPGGMKVARHTGPLLPAAELLNTLLRGWGVSVDDPAAELARAHENYLLYSEHTWGGSAAVNQYGDAFFSKPADAFKNLEGSWEDKTDYIRTAGRLAESLLASNLAALARSVQRAGPRAVVFNPLPWKRSGVVEINGQVRLVHDVPPSGYVTLPLSPPEGGTTSVEHPVRSTGFSRSVPGDCIENAFLRIRLDPARGGIVSLVDQRTGREWVDPAAEFALGQYLNERFDKAQTDGYCRDYQQGRWGGTLHPGMHKPGLPGNVPYRAATGRGWLLKISSSGARTTAIMEMPGDATNHLPATTLRVTLDEGAPFVDLELTVKDKARDNWPEADWLCLPFKVAQPSFQVGRNLGVMDPAKDILRGANRHLYAVGGGVTLAGADGAAMSVCPLDHPLVSLGTPGIWRFSLDYVPTNPVVFVNLYNNQWNTNYRYWYPGTWSSRVRIQPGGDAVAAMETRAPLQVAVVDGAAGTLPESAEGVSVSRPGVAVTAFQPGFLRVWEQAGRGGPVTVGVPAGCRTAQPVNLRGESRGAPIQVRDRRILFDLPAYSPASFVLQ
jgi:alpha-mannosidase